MDMLYPPEYRRQNLATEIVQKSIDEVKAEFQRKGISSFYVEAVVGIDNLASQKLANKLLSDKFEEITDDVSGENAYHYFCLVQW
ncbi:hypothetical protein [Shewanella sp. T24-MNA-CIBAN-0130]|uniref:hypothetical protein n=1 Tax=Shewanella sp. T24-MNA-CIBAN-0130 TaxID=3140470 RepID=UPI0033286DDD